MVEKLIPLAPLDVAGDLRRCAAQDGRVRCEGCGYETVCQNNGDCVSMLMAEAAQVIEAEQAILEQLRDGCTLMPADALLIQPDSRFARVRIPGSGREYVVFPNPMGE